jgi:hypothetical protein
MNDFDLAFERLRRADPMTARRATAQIPARRPADLPEEIMRSTTQHAAATRRPILVGAAAVIALGLGLAVVAAAASDGGSVPVAGAGRGQDQAVTVGGGLGMCVETYDLQTLTRRDHAFDGVVRSIDGTRAEFEVREWFRGGSGSTITLDGAADPGAVTVDEVATLRVGERYLVAGSGGFVWGCGFTRTYSEAVAGQWRAALG